MKRLVHLAAAVCWWAGLALGPTAKAALWPARVLQVVDGDTVRVQAEPPTAADPPIIKLRLQGLDAPERCQDGGTRASELLAARVLQREVEIEDDGVRDGYGRLIGRLWVDGEDVGGWLVSQGLAWNDRYRQQPGPYARQEHRARAEGRGVFADPEAEEPRRFRRRHGPCD